MRSAPKNKCRAADQEQDRRVCLLHSLVVRRFVQRNKWLIRSVVAGSKATGYNKVLKEREEK